MISLACMRASIRMTRMIKTLLMTITYTELDDDDNDQPCLLSKHEDIDQAVDLATSLRPVLVALSLSLIIVILYDVWLHWVDYDENNWNYHKYEWFYLVCMFDDDVNYLLDKIGDHDDDVDPLFPDHPPKRSTCVWHWTLVVGVMKTAMIDISCVWHWALARTLCHFDNTCKDFNDTSNLIFLP